MKTITALYDFRSKQNYIYRTNKIKEISGASLLLDNIYNLFFAELAKVNIKIENGDKKFVLKDFEASDFDGQVIYFGGGNLYIIYKDKGIFVKANKVFTKMIIEKSYDLELLVSFVETTGNFNDDRKNLYDGNKVKKNTQYISKISNVLPITQIDPLTHLAVTEKVDEESISEDRRLKRKCYQEDFDKSKGTSDIEKIAKYNDKDSLIAVIYTDGNAIGKRLKNLTNGLTDYDECVDNLRNFSKEIKNIFVEEPIKNVEMKLSEYNQQFRKIIGGGDETTIICNAHFAHIVLKAYYEALSKHTDYHACSGIAICHKSDPFADVYKIAEACCESAKKRSKTKEENYVDFHFCHSGILNDFDSIRDAQEEQYTNRPYSIDEFFDNVINNEAVIGNDGIVRSDVKGLGEKIIRGELYYGMELERLKAKYKDNYVLQQKDYTDQKFKKTIFDISGIFDLWIEKGETK